MSLNINFRVFRRNNKNLILLWGTGPLIGTQKGSISVSVIDLNTPGGERALRYSRFTPDNPEKFSPDVDGIVISHSLNRMNASEGCTIKVILGEEDESMELLKDVLPANTVVEQRAGDAGSRKVHLYAMNYETERWVPLPHTGLSQARHILMREEEGEG